MRKRTGIPTHDSKVTGTFEPEMMATLVSLAQLEHFSHSS